MINEKQARSFSEVYSFLNLLDDNLKKKIPKELFGIIDENRDKKYLPNYDINESLEEQNISNDAIDFICLIHYNYWCDSEEEKKEIHDILNDNMNANNEKFFEYMKAFKNNESSKSNEKRSAINEKKTIKLGKTVENKLVVINKKSIFKKIWNFIKNIGWKNKKDSK